MAVPSSAQDGFSSGLSSSVPAGIVGGVAGGVVFGMMMQMMGMMPMIAMLAGSESAALGWIIHLAISALFGAAFALLLGNRARSIGASVALGAGYGAVWWVLGALLLMPARLGMPILAIDRMSLMSLAGHLVYGLILGATYSLVKPRLNSWK